MKWQNGQNDENINMTIISPNEMKENGKFCSEAKNIYVEKIDQKDIYYFSS